MAGNCLGFFSSTEAETTIKWFNVCVGRGLCDLKNISRRDCKVTGSKSLKN